MSTRLSGTAPRGLVFARVGGRSLHRTWLTQPAVARGWDVQLSTFDPDFRDDSGDFPLSVDQGTKWDSVARYFRANMDLLDRYDYVLFPDDDLLFDPGVLDELFELNRRHDLYISQPGLTPSSYFSHPLLIACPNFTLRYSTTIEPMCPCIKSSYLREILWCFERWVTGWGQDLIWTHLMADPNRHVAIVDKVRMTHTRPLQSGQIYEHFRRLGIDYEEEMRAIENSFEAMPKTMTVYGGITRQGRKLGRALTQALNGVHLIRSASASRYPDALYRTGSGLIRRSITMVGFRPQQIRRRNDVTSESNFTMADTQ